ncbi:DoxX family protein [Candidatus Nomurabacteria bacterium]|nr:DoxX family protein [Candidatus Nomurabacteria bacterium]
MDLLFILGRLVFGGFFLIKGVEHFKNKEGLVGYAKSKGIEKADTAVIGTGVMMILGGLGIVLGTFVQVAFGLIILFLVPTSIMMHAYWKETDGGKKMNEKISFMSNMALAGAALMMLANMPGPWTWGL